MKYGVLFMADSLESHLVVITAELRLMVVDNGWIVYLDKRLRRNNDYHVERRRWENDISLKLLVPNSQGYEHYKF